MAPVGSKVIEVQVFRPTLEEFANFSNYVEFMESKGAHLAGVAKIIPPPEWKPRKKGYDEEDVSNFLIDSPVDQTIIGQQGVYSLFNVTKKGLRVAKFRELANSQKYAPPLDDFDELERSAKFWRNITLNPPMYGADSAGSFYDPDVDQWNITRLNTILTDVIGQQKIEGVNTAYLYFGTWRSTFSWHCEDMDLYSINYVHYGEPKFWYAIPPEHASRFERLADSYFPEASKDCPAYLRHKMCIISPNVLRNNCIPVNKVVQTAGEFMITFPKGYHAGFNLGFNIAESTNFATLRWIDYGKKSTLCMCKADSVRINMDTFVYKFQYDQYEEWKTSRQKKQQKFVLKQGRRNDVLTLSEIARLKPISKKSKKAKRVHCEAIPSTSGAFSMSTGQSLPNAGADFSAPTLSLENSAGISGAGGLQSSIWDSLTDPYSMGRWAEPLENLWQFKVFNMQAEIEFNKARALIEPHCCVCQFFVPKIIARRAEDIPSVSRRILSDLCFSKNSDVNLLHAGHSYNKICPSSSLYSHQKNQTSIDQLLTCCRCAVTVHQRCYGIGEGGHCDEVKGDRSAGRPAWECERCRLACSTAECQLCCLRGGALRPTDQLTWVHVLCALFAPNARFNYDYNSPLPANRRIELHLDAGASSSDKKIGAASAPPPDLPCTYCRSDAGFTLPCSFPHRLCESRVHATCGYDAGCSFELRDWPRLVDVVCARHNGGGGDGTDGCSEGGVALSASVGSFSSAFDSPKFAKRDLVWAKRDNENYLKACICSVQQETYCVVDFDDGTFSNNVYPSDIVECDCVGGTCQGAHNSGSKVKVFWLADGNHYGAIFRRAYAAFTYEIRLENGQMDRCTGDDLTFDPPAEFFSTRRKKCKQHVSTKAERKFVK